MIPAEYRSIVQGPALAVVDRVWPDACSEARIAVAPHTVAQAWAECPRADWMLGIAVRAGVDRRLVVRAACACARTSIHLVSAGEDRPRIALETAEAWSRGEASIEQVRAAGAAWATEAAARAGAARAAEAAAGAAGAAAGAWAAEAAAWSAAWSAAWADAEAAGAAWAAAGVAWAAAGAARAAAWAAAESAAAEAAAGAAWAAGAGAWAEMSAIVRGAITIGDLAAALAAGREETP